MPNVPSESQILSWFDELSNWGRWGDSDELGTLNLITPEIRRIAAGLVRVGKRVSCAWDIEPAVSSKVQRFMINVGQGLQDRHRIHRPSSSSHGADDRMNGAAEWLGMMFHGTSVTHIDALSHIFWDGRMYNGKPAELVTAELGASVNDVRAAKEGIFTRGVLLDIADTRGVDWLQDGEGVFPEDLEAAERASGVRVGQGDAVLVRTGFGRRRPRGGPHEHDLDEDGQAGLHAATLPWLKERGVALIGCDTATDVVPSGYPEIALPVHVIGIASMGLWEIDNCNFEMLAETCSTLARWEFLFSVDPLPVAGATGSPINPMATF